MLETSKDLVNVSLSFGIVLLAVLLAFALYYFIKIMKDLSEMIHEARDTIQELKIICTLGKNFLIRSRKE